MIAIKVSSGQLHINKKGNSTTLLNQNCNGFTLLEALIAIAITAILIVSAVPSWQNMLEKNRIQKATESISHIIKTAHSEALKYQITINLIIKPGSQWCLAMSDLGDCDCSINGDCTIRNSASPVVNSTEFSMTNLTTSGLSGTSPKRIDFEGIRGVIDDIGKLELTGANYSTNISVTKLGQTQCCSDTIRNYPTCS